MPQNTTRDECLCRCYRNDKNGFALVLALSFMAFLLLLIISLITLAQVETRSSNFTLKKTEAEQNALLGLQIALGNLQKLAGPDQRITAPAKIEDDTVDGKHHWTGVWQSGSKGGANDNDFLGWLVSLPDQIDNTLNLPAIDDIDWAQEDDWVAIVNKESVTANEMADYVAAGKVEINDSGYYAFWSDELGTKARISLSESNNTSNSDPDLMAPRYTGFPLISSGFASIQANDTRLCRIFDLNDLSMADIDSAVAKQYYHDLSTYGLGLQVDVQNGGLKKDLSHLLESDTAFTRYFGVGPTESPVGNWPEPYTFHDAEDSYDFPYGAPNWGILASYYRLYREVNNGAISVITPLPTTYSSSQETYQNSKEPYQYNQAIHPIVSLMRLSIAVSYDEDTLTDPSDPSISRTVYKPVLHLKPLIALYNPYDIAISPTDYNLNWEFAPKITITSTYASGTVESVSFNIQEILPENDQYGSFFRWRISTDTDLQAGETRYYALDQSHKMQNWTSSSDFAQMKADWSEDGAYYINLIDATSSSLGTVSDDENAPFIPIATMDGNTASRYSQYTSRSVGEDEKSSRFGFTTDELDRLTVEIPENEAPPQIEVSIDYDVVNNSGESANSINRILYLRTGPGSNTNITAQIIDGYYQEYTDSMRPKEQSSSFDLSALVGYPTDIAAVAFGLRTTNDTEDKHRQIVDANPRALMQSGKQAGFRNSKGFRTIPGWTVFEYKAGDNLEPQIADLDRYTSFWGNTRNSALSDSTATPASHVVLFHVPREPITSIGAFQHAALGRYAHQPTYIFGNSYANSKIPVASTHSSYPEYTRTHYVYDWSYAINQAVWDSYYFSTIPQNSADAADLFDEIENNAQSMPNPRLIPYQPENYKLSNQELADLLTDDNDEATAAIAAAFQMTAGSFNVNSTSIDAWKAFLSSNSNLELPIYNVSSGLSTSTVSESQPISFRSPYSYDQGFVTPENGSNFWNAYRQLTDSELTDLATAIVSEVKDRGPFSSLADFINRRPSATQAAHQRRGAIQAALDSSINNTLDPGLIGYNETDELIIPDFAEDVYNSSDKPGTGMPGWILQSDLLQALGSLMTVRSDTFKIRAYGNSTHPVTGEAAASAWCEAIVQRLPDPVSNGADATYSELQNPTSPFGRKFRIVSLRWLNQNEI
ncbi:hypothetical protein SH580_12025 [Coraliomargarita algicola]|uniref:Uncharacterized protein n=1 Tax=Coraliomargarita algicola TaxID=3092156 RepID=A0ABZ0RHA2_9BACT|nr:hypothetical protein [Coraliomargarita sp. J2-16]WPJ94160.1 hypothetical protein SH580_12025 [Coraliomargarita sp. J2-16]